MDPVLHYFKTLNNVSYGESVNKLFTETINNLCNNIQITQILLDFPRVLQANFYYICCTYVC
jgi:hypothetical protein